MVFIDVVNVSLGQLRVVKEFSFIRAESDVFETEEFAVVFLDDNQDVFSSNTETSSLVVSRLYI